jgi:hypothetical protein
LNSPDQDALAQHRLSADNLRQTFNVDRDLLQLLKATPELDARVAELETRYDSDRLGIIAVGATVYEAVPEVAQVLRKHGISGRDYVLTKILAMIVEIVADPVATAFVQREGRSDPFFNIPALKFWTAMDPALKTEAAAWEEVRRELGKLGRHRVW